MSASRQLFTTGIDEITNLKFIYGRDVLILQRNITVYLQESTMAATRRFFANAAAAVRSFSIELYAAHGGYAPAVRG
jgi:hypothetical protein